MQHISKATLRFYRQSPKKVRLVVDIIRDLSVVDALAQLNHAPKRAAEVLLKLVNSAVANAMNVNDQLTQEDLFIKEVTVDGGPTLKRFRPRAHGRAAMIRKRTSHIKIVLGVKRVKKTPKNKRLKNSKQA